MVIFLIGDLAKTYRSDGRTVEALSGFSAKLSEGKLTAIVGASGCGKTTLLRILACQVPFDAGAVSFRGEPLPSPYSRAGSRFRSRSVGYVFQEFGLVEDQTALANTALPLHYAGVGRRRAEAMARQLLSDVGLGDEAEAEVRRLSGGQRQRVAIARANANRPAAILADEPTSSLDPSNRDMVVSALRALADAGACVVIATHDEDVWAQCDEVIALRSMADGKLSPMER